MKEVYGFELEGSTYQFEFDIIDYHEELVIIEKKNSFLRYRKELDPDSTFILFQLEEPTITNLFWDYGFKTNQMKYYLYADSVSSFKIVSGENLQKEMALLQFKEHLLGEENLKSPVYFVDKEYIELINGIAKAYDIEVSFLVLDKTLKND